MQERDHKADYHRLALLLGKVDESARPCRGIVNSIDGFVRGMIDLDEDEPLLDFVDVDYHKATATLAQLLGMVVHSAKVLEKALEDIEDEDQKRNV